MEWTESKTKAQKVSGRRKSMQEVDLVTPNPPISAESLPVTPPSFRYLNTNSIFYFCLIDPEFLDFSCLYFEKF